MTAWQVIAVAVPGWLALSALVSLAVSRAVRIRDEQETPTSRRVPTDRPSELPDNNDLTALLDATEERTEWTTTR